MKHIITYETLKDNWNDFVKTRQMQKDIQEYFFGKYPKKLNILNYQGPIKTTTLNILLKFAINKKDTELIKMVNDLKNKYAEFNLERDINKYNL